MPADSLFDMARRSCARQSRSLTDIGTVPYNLIRPALLKIDNPDQLYQLEQNCPHIIGEDGEIWLNMIKRDIPGWDTKPHQPSNPKNWYKVYRKLKKEAKLEMEAGEEKLRAALNSINANREQNTAQVITRNVVPRQAVPRRRKIAHDYMSGRTGSKGAHKMTVLEKIRKDARDASSRKMSRPTHELIKRSAIVRQAPKTFVEDLKHQQQIEMRPAKIAPPSTARPPRPPLNAPAKDTGYNVMQDREARLKALKNGKSVNTSGASRMSSSITQNGLDTRNTGNGLSIDFLEDDDEDDDLFGESTKPKAPSRASGLSSPQTSGLKRKVAPSLFMTSSTPKRRDLGIK